MSQTCRLLRDPSTFRLDRRQPRSKGRKRFPRSVTEAEMAREPLSVSSLGIVERPYTGFLPDRGARRQAKTGTLVEPRTEAGLEGRRNKVPGITRTPENINLVCSLRRTGKRASHRGKDPRPPKGEHISSLRTVRPRQGAVLRPCRPRRAASAFSPSGSPVSGGSRPG